ncbi:hypothetical protein Hanom_Chr10g00925391 [Helianthus anomalus]
MSSFTVTMLSLALLVVSTMSSMSPTTAPQTSVDDITPAPSSMSPSPWLSVGDSPPYERDAASPSPAMTLDASPPSDSVAPAPAPSSGVLNKATVGFFAVGVLTVALLV